ncbi:MAG: hypothetical protein ACD_7C00030G0001 [uncultured bacterium]|nr:MAG: hypothetical protein ACD_7C00030G0001 [uncultured bacterium]HBR79027.1 hypothetical protein [Candidatus Moranbacteria bacterium]
MADNNKKDDSKKESPAKNMAKAEKFVESLQFIGILGAIIMGLRQPPKPGEAVVGDKQVPNWLLSAFPQFTAEDEVEYNLILSSLADASKIALKEFEFLLKKEGIFDEVKFRVLLVKIRREFLDKMRNPMPENKSTTLTFGALQLNDAVADFSKLLNDEKVAGRTPEQIFCNQKLIADNLKLIEKKSFLKRLSEHKLETACGLIFTVLTFIAILKKILS